MFKYDNSRILILGGGDGGLLKELLTLNDSKPKEVIMVELDQLVMEACSRHMPSVCEPFLSKRNGPNYSVITGDAIKYMENQKASVYKVAILSDSRFLTR
jgi:spermine synthase